jgi:hypothetical protein
MVDVKYAWLAALVAVVVAAVLLWPRRLVWTRAPSTGKHYRVKPLPDREAAADRLADLEARLRSFLDAADQVAPGDPRLRNVRRRWNGTLAETPTAKDVAYSIGKDSVYMCVRDPSGRLDDVNTSLFVLIHELAHLATDDWGHPAVFWTNMKFLLELAERTGTYTYQDLDSGVVTYCGRVLGGSPLSCVKNGSCASELRGAAAAKRSAPW